MADREKSVEDENTKIWISRERKELFRSNKKKIDENIDELMNWWKIKNWWKIADTSFKNDEKCFSFHLKSSFCSQDIQVFILIFLVMYKNGMIRKIMLILKFMTSQSG